MQLTGDRAAFQNERTLIVANHESFLDGLLLGAFCRWPRPSWCTPRCGQVVLPLAVALCAAPGRGFRQPVGHQADLPLVETGTPVVIFPEGRLTVTGSLMKVYDGAAFVAAKTGATVVPVRIEGSGRSYFGRLAGIYPLRCLPKIRIMIQPRRHIPMPRCPRRSSAAARRRAHAPHSADMLVATRPRKTLFAAFLDAKATFGSSYRLIEDVDFTRNPMARCCAWRSGLAGCSSAIRAPARSSA